MVISFLSEIELTFCAQVNGFKYCCLKRIILFNFLYSYMILSVWLVWFASVVFLCHINSYGLFNFKSLLCIYTYQYHHRVVPLARISLTLSRHFSLSFITSGRSSGLHPVSSHHHHHHVVLVARISLTIYRHSSLSFIASGRSSGLHPVSSHHHHNHVVPVARISLTLSRHTSLSFIASGRSSGLHPVSSRRCWMYVRAGRLALARPCVGVHKSTSLMSSSLLLQQCPACLDKPI